jgi:mannose-6-phosphate isomerase-like protein (cupin superfamily)
MPLDKESPVASTPTPRHFVPNEGNTYKLGRMTLTFKTTAADNAGAYTLLDASEPPGSGAGRHRHATYDETFIINDGHYEFQVGDQMLKIGPGEVVFVPRGTPHAFKSIGPEIGRQLVISSPGGIFDAFISEVANSTGQTSTSPNPGPATDFRAIAAKYGIEFLE